MARIARVVAPGVAHHVTQRGNRRLPTFFCDDDYELYLSFMAQWCVRFKVDVWAYCLMPNHVHLVAVPHDELGLCRAIGEAHRRYTRHVNLREGWRGHLWQGRFASFVMDNKHVLAAVRYIELNPVRAGLVENPDDYPWSSAKAHLSGTDDCLVKVRPMLDEIGDWRKYLSQSEEEKELAAIRRHERTGRPLGNDSFIEKLEELTGRFLRCKKRGPKGPRKS